ncbi:Electron transfer protein 1 [Durusdinium trenchii]|uniref:Mitochondrial n=2 Tax=Durusdinium trenchii TaxID=1381693 RepID=A0ABP0QA14_9DINO
MASPPMRAFLFQLWHRSVAPLKTHTRGFGLPRRRLECRFFSTGGPGQTDHDRARAFVLERGYTPAIADGIMAALKSPGAGIPQGRLYATVQEMAGRWEVGEDAGLHSLAKSVEQELHLQEGKRLVRFHVQPPEGEPFECEGFEGMSLKDIAEYGSGEGASLLKEYIECACSGVMACSTCHVYLDASSFKALGPADEAEEDMIELAFEPAETSRLGCQLRLSSQLEGMTVTIPGGANNMFDHIPFE